MEMKCNAVACSRCGKVHSTEKGCKVKDVRKQESKTSMCKFGVQQSSDWCSCLLNPSPEKGMGCIVTQQSMEMPTMEDYEKCEFKMKEGKSCSNCGHGELFGGGNYRCTISAGRECLPGSIWTYILWVPRLTLKESILSLYRTVTDDPTATYEDVIKEFFEDTSEGVFTEEQFDKFYETCGASLIGSDNYNSMKRKALKNKYIVNCNVDEPYIKHNVMEYKNKNYIRQKSICESCLNCAFHKKDYVQNGRCIFDSHRCADQKLIWKSFDDVEIDETLALMRGHIGDIYLKGALKHLFTLERVKMVDGRMQASIYIERNPVAMQLQWTQIGHLHLVTAKELEEYFNRKD